ncbi:MAG TPA: hypothetical protein VF002_01425 [Gaiellaceae bacterium]
MSDDWTAGLPEHVASYLVRRALSTIPESVRDTLAQLSPEELETLERVGASLQEAGVEPIGYAMIIH